jgi:glutaredoxin
VKEFLSRAGRDFVHRNVDEDDDAHRELVALGFRTVPLTIVGRHRIKGYDPAALRAALREIDAR